MLKKSFSREQLIKICKYYKIYSKYILMNKYIKEKNDPEFLDEEHEGTCRFIDTYMGIETEKFDLEEVLKQKILKKKKVVVETMTEEQ